jgi:hypothetical protein
MSAHLLLWNFSNTSLTSSVRLHLTLNNHEEDTTNEQQEESDTVSHDDTQHASSTEQEAPAADYTVQEWGNHSSLSTFEPAWGTGPMKDKTEDASWGTVPTSTPSNNYSPEKNPHRSGICQYCEVNLRSRKMNGPLTCSEYRYLLDYDKRLE